MAKFQFYASTGYPKTARKELVEIPDEDLAGDDWEEVVTEQFNEWLCSTCDIGWSKIED